VRLAQGYGDYYNNVRLNSPIGHITLRDMLAGRQTGIHAKSDRMLDEIRKRAPGSSSEDAALRTTVRFSPVVAK
jgi:hypothetical protein